MKIHEITEDYDSLLTSIINKKKYPVFINPTRTEIKELGQETNLVRFIAYNGDFYVFNGEILHANAIKHLKLGIDSNPDINVAFLGIARPLHNGKLEYYDSNQIKTSDTGQILKMYSYIAKYFE